MSAVTERNPLSFQSLEAIIHQRFGVQQQRVKQDLYFLFRNAPSLLPKEDTYGIGLYLKRNSCSLTHSQLTVNNDGSSQVMLLLEGTIPITYRGGTYHIPMNIWLPPDYPLKPPACYVVPTSEMVLKTQHLLVDANGFCRVPYIEQWSPDYSNVAELVLGLMALFSHDPPVFAKPPSYENSLKRPKTQLLPHAFHSTLPQHYSSTTTATTSTVATPPYSSSSKATSTTNGTTTPSTTTTSSTTTNTTTSTTTSSSSPTHFSRYEHKDEKKQLTDKLYKELTLYSKRITDDVNTLFHSQQQVEEHAKRLERVVMIMEEEKDKLERNANILEEKDAELSAWLEQYSTKQLHVDELVIPADPLSQQLFELVAEDQSIEDTLYTLNKALERDRMDLETFLKLSRVLSRDQFMIRALCKKVKHLQEQQRQGQQHHPNNLI